MNKQEVVIDIYEPSVVTDPASYLPAVHDTTDLVTLKPNAARTIVAVASNLIVLGLVGWRIRNYLRDRRQTRQVSESAPSVVSIRAVMISYAVRTPAIFIDDECC